MLRSGRAAGSPGRPAGRRPGSGTARWRSRSARTTRAACVVARSFTEVGLMRVSIGPGHQRERAGLRRVAGSAPSRRWRRAPARRAGTRRRRGRRARWCSRKRIRWSTYSSKPKRPWPERHVAGVVPVGDVDVVVGSSVRTVPRSSVAKWPDSGATTSTLGCSVAMSLRKRSSVPKGVDDDGLLGHRHDAVADRDGIDAVGRAREGEPGPHHHPGARGPPGHGLAEARMGPGRDGIVQDPAPGAGLLGEVDLDLEGIIQHGAGSHARSARKRGRSRRKEKAATPLCAACSLRAKD